MSEFEEYQIPKSKKGQNILWLVCGLIVATIFVTAVYYLTKVHKPASFQSRQVNVTIAKGMRTRQIAQQLEDEHVISSSFIFLIYSELHSAGSKFEAGDYMLNSDMTIPQIVNILTQGKVASADNTVTIIEGLSNSQIAQELVDQKIISSTSDFKQSLRTSFNFKFSDVAKQFNYQGFLFPDTYNLGRYPTASELIQKMLSNFESKFTDQMLTDMQAKKLNLGQVMVMASIIEKEVGRNKKNLTADDLAQMQNERLLVASVFYNRLKLGMKLESDATVNYVTGKTDPSISLQDTKINSPYNTYLNFGLPPTPISNPGIGSIMAAIYPSSSDYLYFLNKPDGEAVFAKTLDEQNANKAEYLK
jgi:UPF0755 protein